MPTNQFCGWQLGRGLWTILCGRLLGRSLDDSGVTSVSTSAPLVVSSGRLLLLAMILFSWASSWLSGSSLYPGSVFRDDLLGGGLPSVGTRPRGGCLFSGVAAVLLKFLVSHLRIPVCGLSLQLTISVIVKISWCCIILWDRW